MRAATARLRLALMWLGIGWLAASSATAGPKVEVCHLPPGNPNNLHTITISENALSAHLAHGDLVGSCSSLCADICDDGDACTVDDTGDCEVVGCPIAPDPVDCNDGLSCTVDGCDSLTGCFNQPVVCTPSDPCHISTCAEPEGVCMETPVVCDPGQACNIATGQCEPPGDCDVSDPINGALDALLFENRGSSGPFVSEVHVAIDSNLLEPGQIGNVFLDIGIVSQNGVFHEHGSGVFALTDVTPLDTFGGVTTVRVDWGERDTEERIQDDQYTVCTTVRCGNNVSVERCDTFP